MVGFNHLEYFCTFLLLVKIFNVCMNKDVGILNHDVKTFINHLSISLPVDHVSHLVSTQRMLNPPLHNSRRRRLSIKLRLYIGQP
jgi:hypothetical protein